MILKEQVNAVLSSRDDYVDAHNYYEGEVAEVFASRRLAAAFNRTGYKSRLNFCRPVVNAVQNRLDIAAITGGTKAAQDVINKVWSDNELALESNEVHRDALVYGDAFAMLWVDENGDIDIAFDTPLTTAIVYDPESPRKKLYAVKMWESGEKTHLNIYTKDYVYKYTSEGTQVTDGAQWTLVDTLDNPFDGIPVFHFRTQRPFGRPEHKDAYDAQDYINKQFVTSMFVSDYQGANQRYAIRKAGEGNETEDFEDNDTERENAGSLKNGPGELWDLVGYDKVGEFKPADPAVFWNPIKDTVRSMASLTDTPLHYFEKTGNVPSGEALRVAEAPLIKKVNDRQISFGHAWAEMFKFILRASGIKSEVNVKWNDVESLDELERLDLALKKRNAGWSVKRVLLEAGYEETVADNIIAEAAQERADGSAAGYATPQARVQTQNDARNVDDKTAANPV